MGSSLSRLPLPCFSCTLLLGSCAVRIEHRTARLAILGHEHGEVDVAALTLFVHEKLRTSQSSLGARCP